MKEGSILLRLQGHGRLLVLRKWENHLFFQKILKSGQCGCSNKTEQWPDLQGHETLGAGTAPWQEELWFSSGALALAALCLSSPLGT